MLWLWRIKNTVSNVMRSSESHYLILMKHLFPKMSCSSLTDPAMLRTHPQGWCISHMDQWYWFIETFRSLHKRSVSFSSFRNLSVSMWKKSWLKCIVLTKACWLKRVGVVTERISDHNDTNKRNNYLNLICTLTDKLITLSY